MDYEKLKKYFYIWLFAVLLTLSMNCNQTPGNTASDSRATDKTIPRYQIDTVVTIGVDTAGTKENEPYQFAGVGSITCDDNGNLYVLESRQHRARVFDKNGKFQREMFQKGQGPGDLSNPGGIRYNPFSNTILIINENGYSLKEFDLYGKLLRTIRPPEQFFWYYQFLSKDGIIYTSMCKYGDKDYDNFKEFYLSNGKVIRGYLPMNDDKRADIFGGVQRFAIKGNALWTSTIDDVDLIALDLSTGNLIKRIKMPGVHKENRVIEMTTKSGMKALGLLGYNYAQPILLDGELFALWTVKDFDLMKGNRDAFVYPESCKLSLYRVEDDNRAVKVGDLAGCDFMRLEATHKNRIVLSAMNPYPYVKIVEVKKL